MIEKNIFQSWYTHKLHPFIENKINSFKSMNPEYKHFLYTDDDMDKFVNENFPGEISDCYNRLNIIVAKVDFWRYLVLYKYGGIYVDMDSSIEKPLRDLISNEDEAIITAEKNPGFYVQWALIYKKNHPILKKVIDLVVDNIKNNKYPNNLHKTTGPTVYAKAVVETHNGLFKNKLDHASIDIHTDITYIKNDISYRLYSIDYNNYFCFKYDGCQYLYINKKHWTQDQYEKPLLKTI